ncbi:MAG: hydrogenase iron-sulfur subunit [Gammaproteobacteria bacterium]|nr:hydrogenase iron-sulfur subunit [Gammaproteobacteria bacterium]MCF6362511.1 hydrogenase iron-sulfur subunit [Gammaproteobacteria bacterium]
MLKLFQDTGRRAFLFADRLANAIFGSKWNPLYHLGTMAFFFFYIVLASGIYIYIFYDTSVVDAYTSVEYMTHEQWYLAGIMRSLHRYASDAMVATMVLHLLRGFFFDRYRGARWFSWTTGIPMLVMVFAIGITGYWLVWDLLGQFVAVRTSEWIDWLPIIAEPTARNFLTNTSVTDLFFRLLVVIHVGLPLMLLGLMLLHVTRLNDAKINPPAGLAIGATVALVVLSLVKPAVSHEAADLSTLPTQLNLDWFYLFIYPLMDRWSMGTVWALVGGGLLLLALLPWMPPKRREPVAVVYPDDCSGCNLCIVDCPYEAIMLEARTGATSAGRYQHLPIAVVDESKCVSCGICTGSCPSSTPFRQTDEIRTGIDMPHKNIQDLHAATREALTKLTGQTKVLVYGCDHGVEMSKVMQAEVAMISLPCTGALPPSFIVYALRQGADGVFLTGCRSGDCFHRLGNDWVDQRITHHRKPYLKRSVPRERVRRYWAATSDHKQLVNEIESFCQSLRDMSPAAATAEAQDVLPGSETRE